MEDAGRIYLGILMSDCIEDCNLRDLRTVLRKPDADPNILLPEVNYAPIHKAAASENEDFGEEATRLLLDHKGDPNVRADENLTPVHVAASWGHLKVLSLLLDRGGSPWQKDDQGKSAFDYAVENNDTKALQLLEDFCEEAKVRNEKLMISILKKVPRIKEPKSTSTTVRNDSDDIDSDALYRNINMKRKKLKKCKNYFSSLHNYSETGEPEMCLTNGTMDSEQLLSLDSNACYLNSYGTTREACENFSSLLYTSDNSSCIEEKNLSVKSNTKESEGQTSSNASISFDLISTFSSTSSSFQNESSLGIRYLKECKSEKEENKESLLVEDVVLSSHTSPLCILASDDKNSSDKSIFSSVCPNYSVNKSNKEKLDCGLPRKSIARSSLMPLVEVPKIIITRPSCPMEHGELIDETLDDSSHKIMPSSSILDAKCEIACAALNKHNLPSEDFQTKNRIHHWLNNIEIHSAAISTDSKNSYQPCESSVEMRLNTAAFESDLICDTSDSTTVSECYKYVDEEKGIVLLEERWMANGAYHSDSAQSEQSSSSYVLSSNVETSNTENLQEELKTHGIYYGPVTATTKRVYQRQLHKKKKYNVSFSRPESSYSLELQRTLRESHNTYFLTQGSNLEQKITEQFSKKDNKIIWREGNLKTSFTYLLLDPRITKNLPNRAANITPRLVWAIFLKSIFYIGKGKRARPYAHLYEAVQYSNTSTLRYANTKVKHICEIWRDGFGVICLHIFQNVIPVEAYTREAAMIDAIGLQNLCNIKRSEYYGKAAEWHSQDRRILGVYLLYKALQIFLSEGERHLSPWDIM